MNDELTQGGATMTTTSKPTVADRSVVKANPAECSFPDRNRLRADAAAAAGGTGGAGCGTGAAYVTNTPALGTARGSEGAGGAAGPRASAIRSQAGFSTTT